MNDGENTTAYPAIHKAALLIALDNGGINRAHGADTHEQEVAKLLAKHDSDVLRPIEAWLGALSDEDMETVCAGEFSEQECILASSPPWTDHLLEQFFEGAE